MMEAAANATAASPMQSTHFYLSESTDYPRFADTMDKYGYDWEAYKVHTEDHYILTTFRVLGKTGEPRPADSKGSVLLQHGDMEDGARWVSNMDGKPFHLLLVDEGYDVWIGSNRGTEYSWDHETLSSKDDPAYWNWTWGDMGMYDDVANIKTMQNVTGEEKVFYVGYSQGNVQMTYALTHLEDSFFADALYKYVALGPCFVSWDPRSPEEYAEEMQLFVDNKIYAINGPNWDQDLQTICDNFPKRYCKKYTDYTGYPG